MKSIRNAIIVKVSQSRSCGEERATIILDMWRDDIK